jgi:hypothetical protein
MSNNAETNNHNLDINTLKSTINSLIQENKKLLESNEQLKIEDSKLRDFINISALQLETQIQLILGWSKLLSGDDVGSSQLIPDITREGIIQAIYRTALKLKKLTEDMKLMFQEWRVRD